MSQGFEEIINSINNIDFFKKYGFVPAKERGENAEGECPFCHKKKFNLNMEKGLWKCFACGRSGNQISFLAQLHNTNNGEAIKEIRKYLGINDPPTAGRKGPKASRADKDNTAQGGQDVPPWSGSEPGPGAADPQGPQTDAGPPENAQDSNPGAAEAGSTDSPQSDIGPSESGSDESTGPTETGRNDMDDNDGKHPYERLIELAQLNPEDREGLKKKRGFTDNIIDEFRFRSGGDYLREIIEVLKTEYSEDRLQEVGILRNVNGTLLPEKQLVEERILIPYINEEGRVYHLRPHKLGFKSVQVEVYCRKILAANPSKIVLTEGEFKAAALWQWGIPALALPGISAFGKNNFDRLTAILQEYDVKKVIVAFDSEEKGNPAFSNFKERLEDRFDTQYWSYMMAYRLNKSGFVTSIAWLPPEWRINGKVDFDGALAQGRSASDIHKVLKSAKLPQEFLESLEEDAQRIVKKKVAKFFTKLNIRREFNKYVVKIPNGKNGDSYEKTISNFVLNIKSNFYDGENVLRYVQLINEYGEYSETLSIEAGSMSGLDAFKKFILSKGNYIFEGTSQDLVNMWKYEFLHNDGELIFMPEHIGWIEKHKIWLFGNMAIKNGNIYRPDNDGIIWVEGKGFKPQGQDIKDEGKSGTLPYLSEKEINIVDVAEKLRITVGGYEAYLAIGWAIGTIFSKEIFKKYRYFPILFPHGRRYSGKTTFMPWLMKFFGIETDGFKLDKTTTPNGLARGLAYRSCLGVWFDEYRNDPEITNKNSFFRSAYNRQVSLKGTATSFQTKGFGVNSTIAISGQEAPRDNALFTRCLFIQFSEHKRSGEYLDWIYKNSDYFSSFTLKLILNYELYKDKILENIEELRKILIDRGITERTAGNYAICAGALDAVVLRDDNFIRWIEKECQELKITGEQDHMLNQFWSDISTMIADGEFGEKYIKVEDKKLYVWMKAVYDKWCIFFKKKTGREPFDYYSIIRLLKEEPYYIDSKKYKLAKSSKNVVIINIEAANDTVIEIADALDDMGLNH